ncbi:hypothetical protein LTR08_000525 [Meristemomyces frigidus]|nr:hypothetical protein LTR08_000525 [Meristemomyces frigidus]
MAIKQPQTDEEARALMERFVRTYSTASHYDNFDNPLNRCVTCKSASLETETTPARATLVFDIPKLYGNNPAANSVHGGAIAMFFDNITSLPMLAVRKWWDGQSGVTRTLSVTYFRPAQMGERVVIEAEVVGYGRRNATIRGVMKREKDGVVLATCQHDKARGEGGEHFSVHKM